MGLWHGANWTFVLWGIYHATLVHGYRLVTSKISWNEGVCSELGLTCHNVWVRSWPDGYRFDVNRLERL